MKQLISRFLVDDSGATAIEYGLLAAILGMGLVVGLTNLKNGLTNLFNGIEDEIPE
jgi:pilus assembly protein Flp/PilA